MGFLPRLNVERLYLACSVVEEAHGIASLSLDGAKTSLRNNTQCAHCPLPCMEQ